MKEFNCKSCGACCGPVPVTRYELAMVRKAIKKMEPEQIERLKSQKRDALQCPLLDMETMKCSVYEYRPEICRMFGFYEGMKCPNNPKHAQIGREQGAAHLKEVNKDDEILGILTFDFNWNSGLLPQATGTNEYA